VKPAIVVVAYNRSKTLKRLLKSIESAQYANVVELIISIDYSDNHKVYEYAEAFDWKHGNKTIIVRNEHFGLKKHIIACGRLVKDYGSIILLEDDLYVSPLFYQYAKNAIQFYRDDRRIAGISLYSQRFNETARMGFYPIDDGSDIFFLQIASSWGQCWTSSQWKSFEQWYKDHKDTMIRADDKIPHNVAIWPESSWKKIFIRYLVESGKYFVYPRKSFTTNFHDQGTHHLIKKNLLQVPLDTRYTRWIFNDLGDSIAVYDAFYEIAPETLDKMTDIFNGFDFTVDLYGQKKKDQIDTKYLLRPGFCRQPLMTFARELKPTELNIIDCIEGKDIMFGKTADFKLSLETQNIDNISYYFSIPTEYIHEQNTTKVEQIKIINEESKNIRPDGGSLQRKIRDFILRIMRKIYAIAKMTK
jgi:glycosyltransferase involved in cell wall biosynthesis